ncbi:O-acetyltransferase [Amylocystis lapponica]|nr:O-acetyltransferase [Amylocystis lapponica]
MAPRRFSFSLNPLWSHYVALTSLVLAVLLGLVRYLILDRPDPLHCDALLTEGQWLDDKFKNWQPEGCMLYTYQPKDVSACMGKQRVVFIGDSHKHTDYFFTSASGTPLAFYWDPYLNTSHTQNFITPPATLSIGSPSVVSSDRPALLVLGAGLWYLRYEESGGLPAWEAKIESVLDTLSQAPASPADSIVLLPVEDVVSSKLARERAASMRAPDIDAMNSDLLHRIRPPALRDPFAFFPSPASAAPRAPAPVALPLVFNRMLDASQTEDGLHFSDALVAVQARVLLNMHCNDVLPKTFPMDKTCCRRYPRPSPLHLLVLAVTILWGPACWVLSRRLTNHPFIGEAEMPAVVFSAAAALIFIADRTGFWLKEQKQFNPWTFSLLSLLSLGVGLLTVKRAEQDLGFLNREQTDEWKGWMQVAILIYHYLGASKISGIYNPIRVLVAAYLYMTGYGHTTFYIKKADFGFLRVAQILVRLNLLTLLLAYTMNTDYLSYYFAPLVSLWFLIIYATMAVASRYNDRTIFLVSKIFVSMGLVTWFMREPMLLETAFQFLERVCGIHWSAREWAFRVNLDLWIVYSGMFSALAVIKIREHRLTDHPQWAFAVKGAIGASAIVLLWFFAFELSQPDKFAYNGWHPYMSFLPVGAFVVLRNATPVLRSAPRACSRLWGRARSKPSSSNTTSGSRATPTACCSSSPARAGAPRTSSITTVAFVYLSHHVAQATGEVTKWVCGIAKPQTLPVTADGASTAPSGARRTVPPAQPPAQGEVIFMMPQADGESRKDSQGNSVPLEPDTPMRAQRRWVDRLADGPANSSAAPGFRVWYGETEWKPGVKTKIGIGLGAMWLLNIMWPYP